MSTRLLPLQEDLFQKWYRNYAKKLNLSQNPDDPEHFYDYRGAWLSGAEPDQLGHMSSQFKTQNHPRRFLDGYDTVSGQPINVGTIMDELLKRNQ